MFNSICVGSPRITRYFGLVFATICAATAGCCICDNPFDEYYAAYGGRNPRVDMVHGRVGSAFRDAGSTGVGGPLETAPRYDEYGNDMPEGSYESTEAYYDGGTMDGQPFQLNESMPMDSTPLDEGTYSSPPYNEQPLERVPRSADENSDELPSESDYGLEPPADSRSLESESSNLDDDEPGFDFSEPPDIAPQEPSPTPADEPDFEPVPDEFPDSSPMESESLTPPQNEDTIVEPSLDDLDFD